MEDILQKTTKINLSYFLYLFVLSLIIYDKDKLSSTYYFYNYMDVSN
ncbi:hypothetical protein SDC9_139518 [bioreactor metagenome]|uniref:Uncharacterized protein n=1 Tax=bioreactor metagenome TaxID=1076179 RepID=A0A645DUX2_9ZZZZ